MEHRRRHEPANAIAKQGGGSQVSRAVSERDGETGLDYMHARYYASTQGRFIGVDPLSGNVADPQSWNHYSYVTAFTGTILPVAYIPLDQNGNIIKGGHGVIVQENVTATQGDQPTTTGQREAPPRGVLIDLHTFGTGMSTVVATQRVDIVQGSIRLSSSPIQIRKDATSGTITVKTTTPVRVH